MGFYSKSIDILQNIISLVRSHYLIRSYLSNTFVINLLIYIFRNSQGHGVLPVSCRAAGCRPQNIHPDSERGLKYPRNYFLGKFNDDNSS